jgi:hypothetical protein
LIALDLVIAAAIDGMAAIHTGKARHRNGRLTVDRRPRRRRDRRRPERRRCR